MVNAALHRNHRDVHRFSRRANAHENPFWRRNAMTFIRKSKNQRFLRPPARQSGQVAKAPSRQNPGDVHPFSRRAESSHGGCERRNAMTFVRKSKNQGTSRPRTRQSGQVAKASSRQNPGGVRPFSRRTESPIRRVRTPGRRHFRRIKVVCSRPRVRVGGPEIHIGSIGSIGT